ANGGAGGTVTTRDSTATGSPFNWPSSYNPAGVPSNPSGKHSAGTNCMGSACHASSQASRAFAFGGTIYQPGGTNPAANVQVAITFGSTTVTTYSGSNGNFWLPLSAAASIDWSNATVHVRNSKGELAKPSTATVNAACNSCHGSSMRITAP
ncbi:MAG TPA: hypothetical protein VKP30_20475, partial [Polyangiaceae bacterium]|nr:hypothetical protein [Polyangiaceae bacterium]